jgi:23S rRNA pseudouridine1911/1915/1917 synthase
VETELTFQVLVDATDRLDRFLAQQLLLSRTQAARLIAIGSVQVNGEKSRASRSLTRGDLLCVRLEDLGDRPLRTITPYDHPLDIVFEDDALLVLNKPAGLVVHPAPGHWSDTLLNALEARGTRLAGGGTGRPGIVHRLDKDTSGLMVLAKSDEVHRKLSRALSRRHVERIYAAVCWGHIDQPVDVAAPIARHPTDRKRMAVLATGRKAATRIEPIARFDVCDLVRLKLATGRTHQIRVHLNHIGHPVVGDPVYGGGGHKRVTGSQRAKGVAIDKATPRQALHAAELRFQHPVTGEYCRFQSDWPHDLAALIRVASDDPDLLDRANVLEYLGFAK